LEQVCLNVPNSSQVTGRRYEMQDLLRVIYERRGKKRIERSQRTEKTSLLN